MKRSHSVFESLYQQTNALKVAKEARAKEEANLKTERELKECTFRPALVGKRDQSKG